MSKFLIISLCILLVATNPIPDNGGTRINTLFNIRGVNSTMNGNSVTGDSLTAEGNIHVSHYNAGATHNQQGAITVHGNGISGIGNQGSDSGNSQYNNSTLTQ